MDIFDDKHRGAEFNWILAQYQKFGYLKKLCRKLNSFSRAVKTLFIGLNSVSPGTLLNKRYSFC